MGRCIKEKKRESASTITWQDLAKKLVQVLQITNEGHLITRTRPGQNLDASKSEQKKRPWALPHQWLSQASIRAEPLSQEDGSQEKHILQHVSPLKSMTVWSECRLSSCSKSDYLISPKHTWQADYIYCMWQQNTGTWSANYEVNMVLFKKQFCFK